MVSIWKSIMFFTIFVVLAVSNIEARPQNLALDPVESDLEEIQNSYYDLPVQQENIYPSIPLDRLQMIIARSNRPSAYLRPTSGATFNELYRVPLSKRQVKYRQCYFNPISCFRK